MKKLMTVLLAWTVLAGVGYARFGETPEQCEQRYGKPKSETKALEPTELAKTYESGGFQITVGFAKDEKGKLTAEWIIYTKEDQKFEVSVSDGILATVPGKWVSREDYLASLKDPEVGKRVLKDASQSCIGIAANITGISISALNITRGAFSGAFYVAAPGGKWTSNLVIVSRKFVRAAVAVKEKRDSEEREKQSKPQPPPGL